LNAAVLRIVSRHVGTGVLPAGHQGLRFAEDSCWRNPSFSARLDTRRQEGAPYRGRPTRKRGGALLK